MALLNLREKFSYLISNIGAVVGACSCTVMIAASFAGLAGVLGVRLSVSLPEPLNNFLQISAQPLLIVSFVLIVFGTMHSRTRLPFILSLVGTPLTYAGMFLITDATGAHAIHSSNPLSIAIFWIGVAPIIASVAILRREGPMGPQLINRLNMAKRLIIAAIIVGILVEVPTVSVGVIQVSQVSLQSQPSIEPFKTVRTDFDNFLWSGQVVVYTNEESYFPRFSSSKATVTINHKISSGTLTIGVMDGAGVWVIRGRSISSSDSQTLTFATESGEPGVWMIILTFREVTGEVEVRINPAGA